MAEALADKGKTLKRLCMTLVLLNVFFSSWHAPQASFQGFFSPARAWAQSGGDFSDEDFLDPFAEETEEGGIRDPLEPLNRAFFQFNDRLYFWVLKPTATVYGAFIPEGVRVALRRAFENILMPVRFVNNLLQGKVDRAGVEVARFALNSTLGAGGLFDPAAWEFGIKAHDEDLGQTLGVYGIGHGIYIHWPIFGPSSIRDTIGTVGDCFLDPVFYLTPGIAESIAVVSADRVNRASLRIGEYEDFKKSALDPYVAMRNAYFQYRSEQVKK